MQQYEEHTKCLLCNSEKLKPLKNYQEHYLVQCSSCDFVFCKRIPTNEELTAHYKTYTRGVTISPITIKRYNELLDDFEKYRQTGNILDIGCGDGFFLEVAKTRGWNVFGTEFTDEAMQVCRSKGITMYQGILNPDNYKGIKFDLITSFEVIEHINNPQEEIKNISEILRPNGAFYVTTPNFNSISRYYLKNKWSMIEYPEHLSYYTARTMSSFLKKNGFRKIYVKTTGINIARLKQSTTVSQSVNEESLREKTENRLIFRLAKNSVNFFLNTFKAGDALKGLYEKK